MWRNKSEGGWRCRVKAYRRHWVTTRRWRLRQQRAQVLAKLDELSKEAASCDP